MAELKTKPTKQNPKAFIKTIKPEEKMKDSLTLLKMFEKETGKKAMMWGSSIVGFGMYHYKSERSTQEGDWPLVAFSPRKQNLTLYILAYKKAPPPLLKKLGKYKVSGSCLHINKLSDVNLKILATLIKKSFQDAERTHK